MVKYSPELARHFTIFFQCFVLMQVFNEFNSRKLDRSERNIMTGLFNNWLFWFIIISTLVIQYLLVEYGGQYVGVSQLSIVEHAFCLAVGAVSLIVGFIIKILPN
jgi:magnesium-transporting ATPase (P-type)